MIRLLTRRQTYKLSRAVVQTKAKTPTAFLSVASRHLVLGIETSCDDTGLALVDSSGNVLWEALSSQWDQVETIRTLLIWPENVCHVLWNFWIRYVTCIYLYKSNIHCTSWHYLLVDNTDPLWLWWHRASSRRCQDASCIRLNSNVHKKFENWSHSAMASHLSVQQTNWPAWLATFTPPSLFQLLLPQRENIKSTCQCYWSVSKRTWRCSF